MIGEIQKNATEKIRVTLTEYKGYNFIDVRVYVENNNGEWIPTKKGIALNRDTIEPLLKLLADGKGKLQDKGGENDGGG